MEMQHMYAGIYAARFVLFAGERLRYFITETFAGRPQEKLDEGELMFRKIEDNIIRCVYNVDTKQENASRILN